MEPLKIKIERSLLEKIIEYIDLISQILSNSNSSFQSDLFQQVNFLNYHYENNILKTNLLFSKENIDLN